MRSYHTDPEILCEITKERLKDVGIKNVTITKRKAAGEIVPEHYEIKVNKDSVAFVYEPIACHSYNIINIHGDKVKIATIDTMLSFYLAFLYADRLYYQKFLKRILCMAQFLFEVQHKNRLSQHGLLKRFSINCYGHQESKEEIRSIKAKKFEQLKDKKTSKEYEEWFLNYTPRNKKTVTKKHKPKKSKRKKTKTKRKSFFHI